MSESATSEATLANEPDEGASFEQVVEQLEGVVARLERGDLPLEDSLAAFERGVRLSRIGTQRLDAAEKRVEELLSSGKTRPFTDTPSGDSSSDQESASQ